MVADAKFLFVVCQVGAEPALKAEVARDLPDLRFAFSRPGFVTFKLPKDRKLTDTFDIGCTFARTSGFSLGKVKAATAETMAKHVWELAGSHAFDQLHVWQRDPALPGERGFEPSTTLLSDEVGAAIVAAQPESASPEGKPLPANRHATARQRVLDCAVVEPNEWWIGWHIAGSPPSRWPGGVPRMNINKEYLSRAYLKITEAIEWSRLPVKSSELCAEIGSAPGGSSQALLERGLRVIGIDPAEMEEEVLAHPRFRHFRMRADDVRRREFRDVRWLFSDANIAPKEMMDSVQDIVTHADVHVRGMLLTLKLSTWKVAEQIPDFVERVRSWGFEDVQTRQLAFNRREICLSAAKPLHVR